MITRSYMSCALAGAALLSSTLLVSACDGPDMVNTTSTTERTTTTAPATPYTPPTAVTTTTTTHTEQPVP